MDDLGGKKPYFWKHPYWLVGWFLCQLVLFSLPAFGWTPSLVGWDSTSPANSKCFILPGKSGMNGEPPDVGYIEGYMAIWVFPKIGVGPQIIHFNRVFHYKPSILGVFPLFLETPIWKDMAILVYFVGKAAMELVGFAKKIEFRSWQDWPWSW